MRMSSRQAPPRSWYGLPGGLAEEIPECDVDRRIGPHFGPRAGVADVRLQGPRVPVYPLRILSQQIGSSRLVDVCLGGLGIEIGLAQPDQALVRVQLYQEEVRELRKPDRLDLGQPHLAADRGLVRPAIPEP